MTEPKYRAIEQAIRARIADGTYPAGTALPSEDALAAEFGVTRPTVRAGLAELRATDAVTVLAGTLEAEGLTAVADRLRAAVEL